MACSKADKAEYRANHLPCDSCGSDIQRGQERLLEDYRLCDVCHQKRQTQKVRQDQRAREQAGREALQHQRRRYLRQWLLVAGEALVGGVVLWCLYSGNGAAEDDPAVPAPASPALGQPGNESEPPLLAMKSAE